MVQLSVHRAGILFVLMHSSIRCLTDVKQLALLSVSDKTGLAALGQVGWEAPVFRAVLLLKLSVF